MSFSQRERAEAALGHVQQAAAEILLAAHDALDMLEEVVATAAVGDILGCLNDLSQSVFKPPWSKEGRAPRAARPTPAGHSPSAGDGAGACPGAGNGRPGSARPEADEPPRASRVERIDVR